MTKQSKSNNIGWTDKTKNPVGGCSHASPGCKHCWAEVSAGGLTGRAAEAIRERYLPVVNNGRWARDEGGKPILTVYPKVIASLVTCTGKHQTDQGWRSKRWFVGSMADLFHPDRPLEHVDAVLGALAGNTKKPVFQLATKHPHRAVDCLAKAAKNWDAAFARSREWLRAQGVDCRAKRTVDPKIVLLTSVENQEWANKRIPALVLARPYVAAIGLSVEPVLGSIDLDATGHFSLLDWVIVGGESGKNARQTQISHIVRIINQCVGAGKPVYNKQLGARPVWSGLYPLLVNAGFRVKKNSAFIPVGEADERGVFSSWEMEFKSKKADDPRDWPPEYRYQQHPEGL